MRLNPELQNLLSMFGQGAQAGPDTSYSSGQRYAQSVAGGQNVPDMIAPGVSYSAARPEGYTQADLQYYNPGPVPVMPSAPTQGTPFSPNEGFVQMPSAPQGVAMPERYTPMITNAESLKNLSDLFNANMPSGNQVSFDPFIDGEPMAIDDLMPSVSSSPIDFSFNPFEEIEPMVEPMVEPMIEDLPSVGSSLIDFSFNPFDEMKPYAPVEIDPMPQPVDVPVNPMPTYFVPETPVVSLQENPTTPVGMPEPVLQEIMQEQDAREELRDIIASKEVLQEMPAQDGIRNEYQMAINDFINESPINKEVYKAELPVGSAINLGVPSLFENVIAPAVIPGLGIAQSIGQSFNPAPTPAPQNIRTSDLVNSFTNNSYDNIRNFGR